MKESAKSIVAEKLGWAGGVVDRLKPEELYFVLAIIERHDIIEKKLHVKNGPREKR